MTSATNSPHSPCIGVFDSGLGGLSVLRAVRRLLPQARLLYVADSGFAPYGEREATFVRQRSLTIAQFLRRQGAQMLVVACNTATAAAVQDLRERFTGWPIVGVEPGVKPAGASTRNGRIGVLATEGTLRSGRFQLLAQAHAAHVQLYLQPCPGLAAAIEHGDLDAPELLDTVERCCQPLRAAAVDTVVLGCTHYPFVAHHIQAALGPSVRLIDTAEAVARRTSQLLPNSPGPRRTPPAHDEPVRLWTTGDAALLSEVTRRWLDFPCRVARLGEEPADPA
ncbi:MAG TPA: glutamate racemase [Burkholderiaceae bacterium]|nr:glutamate racemase [Burkholderiaceae bacterium]HNG79672.1 glutamate racemase [Burkholderiaceae bacterium]